jgi:hypothetical protein
VYTLSIEEYTDGVWAPFKAKDVQLEFVRLDPFVRMTLDNKNGKFEGKFKVPDVYGIFKFVVDYNRVGYTHLFTSTQVFIMVNTYTIFPYNSVNTEKIKSLIYQCLSVILTEGFNVYKIRTLKIDFLR